MGRAETAELSKLDKELIFAFASYQNACHYCIESHRAVAQAYGLEAEALAIYMNRFVDGLGVDMLTEQAQEVGSFIASAEGYDFLVDQLGGA